MTDELSTRRLARQADPIRADAVRVLGAAEVARIDAESAAITERAEVYELAITDRLKAILVLRDTEHGLAMQAHLAALLALEELRCEVLGVPQPVWEEALRRYRVLIRETIDSLKQGFRQQEAMQ